MLSVSAIGSIDKKLIFRKRKGFSDVKKYTETVNPDLPGQVVQKGYFKDAIEEWKEGGYSAEDTQAWNLYARANRKKVSGFNMFTKFKIGADIEAKTWGRLTNCNIYDVKGSSFKVDINVAGDYTGKLYYGTSKLYMINEVPGVFSVDKYTFAVSGLSVLTNYFFYIKNTAIGKEGRTGIYSRKTTIYTPMDIDIGEPAIYRGSYYTGPRTCVNKGNPANATGKINSVEIYCGTKLVSCKVATFFVVSGNYLSTRDQQYIGDVEPGETRIIGVDLDVEAGDYIGLYYSVGYWDKSSSGGNGLWVSTADRIPCVNSSFNLASIAKGSIYGTGSE